MRGLSTKRLVAAAARFRLGGDPEDVGTATRFAMRSVARRYGALSEEIAELDAQLERLVAEASSGKVVRHRLNRGGNRDANRALHLICVVRMRYDERTRRYAARRTAEGKRKREIMRCLKRYVVREVYRVLVSGTSPPPIGSRTGIATSM